MSHDGRLPGPEPTAADTASADPARLLESLRSALLEQQESFDSLLDAVPDSVTVLAEDGRILAVNLAACRSFGRSREELLQLRIYDLNPELPPDRVRRVTHEHADGEPFVHETINIRGDGSSFPVEVYSRVFHFRQQFRVIAVARDITHRLRAEAELRASSARYRQLLQAMDKGVLVQDRDGQVLSANPTACRLFRRSEAELVGGSVRPRDWDFIDEQGQPLPAEQLPSSRALAERRTIASTTVGLFDRDGERQVWLTVTATPQFRDGEDEPFQVISTFGDVTELKRDSDLFLRTQHLAGIGGWDLDSRSRQMYWTEPMSQLLELPAAALRPLDDLLRRIIAADRERVHLAFDDACTLGHAFDLECQAQTPGGRLRWIRLIGEPRRSEAQAFQVVGTLQDISRDKLIEETLRNQALTDPLTGLPNRQAFTERVAAALDHAHLDHGPVVLHVDLDRFKIVNDLLGHAGGDALVRLAAQRLSEVLGELGQVARMSGDEFLILLPSGGRPLGRRIVEAINRRFSQPFLHAGEEFSITASVGVAHYPDDGTTAQQLLQSADCAMLEAKRRGRNTWQPFTPALARQLSDRLLIETQLRRALSNQEFHLVYQPQVDLADGRLRSVEALLRWNNRVLGAMPPDQFIPHAEATGDIVRIGAWVIREACRQLRSWRESGLALQRVAVNVSFRQFLSEDFQEHVLGALEESGLLGTDLELEITERVLIEDAADTLSTLRQLKEHGVVVSIDDFGEGYSALNYLRRLPIDAIKISHGFMREIPASTTDAVLCRAMIQIAHSLGLEVVGEGVETAAQWQFLRAEGADLAQGYLFSRPLAADQVAAYRPPGDGAG